jgi:hypothetical protein
MRRLAFKLSSRVAAPFQFLILPLWAVKKTPHKARASTQGAGAAHGPDGLFGSWGRSVSQPPNRMSPSIPVRFSSVEGHKCPEGRGEKRPRRWCGGGREPVDGFSRCVTRCAPSGGVFSRVSTGRFLNLRAAQFAEAGRLGAWQASSISSRARASSNFLLSPCRSR